MVLFASLSSSALPALLAASTKSGVPPRDNGIPPEATGGEGGESATAVSHNTLALLVAGGPLIPAALRPLSRDDVAVIARDAERRIKSARAIQHSLPEGAVINEAHMMRAAVKDWVKHADKRRAHGRYIQLMRDLNHDSLDWHDFLRGVVHFKSTPHTRFREIEKRQLSVGSLAKLVFKRKGRFTIADITPQCWLLIANSRGEIMKGTLLAPTDFRGSRTRTKPS